MATETQRFLAHDVDGNRVVIVAQRSEPPSGSAGAWHFRTADGRPVRRSAVPDTYTVEGVGTRLTTDDPNEPKE